MTNLVVNATQGATPLDMMLVVGGFNSSNTSHLQVGGPCAFHTQGWVQASEGLVC